MVLGKIIELYKKIYNLPIISYKEEVCNDLIGLYKKKHFFVVMAIYNQKKELFLIRDFNKNIGWELPGGYIKDGENIIDSVNRIVLRETGLEVNEIEPFAIVKNNFNCKNKIIENTGIAFLAHIKGDVKNYPENIKGCFVSNFSCKLPYQNNKIVKLAQVKIKNKKYFPPQNEIDSIKSNFYKFFYILHKLIIKPIGSSSSKKIEKEIMKLIIGQPKTILDASCGDSPIINFLFLKYFPKVCVGNDISWKTITLLKNKNINIIFTNHNILDIPFKIKFDLVIFKNTLHHINKKNQKQVLKKLNKISKQLIIIDVDDPNFSNALSRIWNKYYIHILKDKGNSFLTFFEFKKVLQNLFKRQRVLIKKINTIKGCYYVASIKNFNN